MSFFDDAISSIGRGLAQTAVKAASDATGYDVGGTLNALFGNKQEQGGSDLAQLGVDVASSNIDPAAVTQLQSSLDQQQAEMTDLGNKVDSIAQGVAAIQGEIANIEAMLEKIDQEILYTQWQAANDMMIDKAADIQAAYSRYGRFIAKADEHASSDVAAYLQGIMSSYSGPQAGVSLISSVLVGQGQAKGALELWSNMVVPLVAAGQIDFRDAAAQYVDYYRKAAYTQLQGTNLIMEAYNFDATDAKPEDPSAASDAWATYQNLLITQEAPFIRWLSPIISAGIAAGAGHPEWGYSAITAALQINPGLQQLPASSSTDPSAYYEPSSIYGAAEALLATLYVTGEGDRRIVIHMAYSGKVIADVVSGVELTIDGKGADGKETTLKPARSDDLGRTSIMTGDREEVVDPNLDMGWFDVRRFVYQTAQDGSYDMPDGSYMLTDLNGQDGLEPIETYASSRWNMKLPFLDGGPLGHVMAISSTSPFAFMNFLAYMRPFNFPGEYDGREHHRRRGHES